MVLASCMRTYEKIWMHRHDLDSSASILTLVLIVRVKIPSQWLTMHSILFCSSHHLKCIAQSNYKRQTEDKMEFHNEECTTHPLAVGVACTWTRIWIGKDFNSLRYLSGQRQQRISVIQFKSNGIIEINSQKLNYSLIVGARTDQQTRNENADACAHRPNEDLGLPIVVDKWRRIIYD